MVQTQKQKWLYQRSPDAMEKRHMYTSHLKAYKRVPIQ